MGLHGSIWGFFFCLFIMYSHALKNRSDRYGEATNAAPHVAGQHQARDCGEEARSWSAKRVKKKKKKKKHRMPAVARDRSG